VPTLHGILAEPAFPAAAVIMRRFPVIGGRHYPGRMARFAVVGGVGTAINIVALLLLSRCAGLPLAAASALAVELSAVSNYLLNDSWTFAARTPTVRRFARFNIAAVLGLALNVFTVWFLTRLGLYFLVADLVGIAFGFTLNYAFSVSWVWGRPA
jgi:putative flippase GtrA